MTMGEKKESNIEWIKGLKVGDEVCISNRCNITRILFGNMSSNLFGIPNKPSEILEDEICIISKIRGIMDDGCIIVDNTIYTPEGKPEKSNVLDTSGELVEPTDELRKLAWRFTFRNSIKNVDWTYVSDKAIDNIISIINTEVKRIHPEIKNKEDDTSSGGSDEN